MELQYMKEEAQIKEDPQPNHLPDLHRSQPSKKKKVLCLKCKQDSKIGLSLHQVDNTKQAISLVKRVGKWSRQIKN